MYKMVMGVWIILVQCLLNFAIGQPASERHFVNNELSQIPEDIIQCYTDRGLWDRFNRLPYSVDSLVAFIRKIELHPQVCASSLFSLSGKFNNIILCFLTIFPIHMGFLSVQSFGLLR